MIFVYTILKMLNLIVSSAILAKLRDKHQVSLREIEQCFENLDGDFLEDDLEEHQTDPATLWFVAPTNRGRLLKVIFMSKQGKVTIKSAYEPNIRVIEIYKKFGY